MKKKNMGTHNLCQNSVQKIDFLFIILIESLLIINISYPVHIF